MENQALAYRLVETVVGARDQGRQLPPALASSWLMLRAELPPAHRVLVQELSCEPEHESDLAFVVGGVEQAFRRDEELSVQFGLLLTELAELGAVEADQRATVPASESDPGDPIAASYVADPTDHAAYVTEAAVGDEAAPRSGAPAGTTRRPRSTPNEYVWPLAIGALLLALFALGVYLFAGGDEETTPAAGDDRPVETTQASLSRAAQPVDDIFALPDSDTNAVIAYVEIDHQLLPADDAPLLARVNQLFEARDYQAAIVEQKSLIDALDQQAASPASFADAWSLLAFLYNAAGDASFAVSCQRRSLEYARMAYGKHDTRLARVHIALAAYYREAESTTTARTHLEEGTLIYTQTEELIPPNELAQANRVSSAID